MDKDKLNNEISSALQEFRKLLINYEESKEQKEKLKKLTENLREALRIARDAERNADMKRRKSLGFVAQQQEVIVKLLLIKEENEKLKQMISQMETRLAEIQISRLADQEKKDAEVNNVKQEYFKELIKAQEECDVRVKKLEKEFEMEIQVMKSKIEKGKNEIDEQSNRIKTLHAEINDLKDKAAEDLEAYHNKLSEQDKVHQAELETWKAASLKTTCNQYVCNIMPNFSRSEPFHLMQVSGRSTMYNDISHLPENNSYYRYQQLQDSLTRHYSGNQNDFPTVENSSVSQLPVRIDLTETRNDQYHQYHNSATLESEINVFCQARNNLVSYLPETSNQQTTHTNDNPQTLTGSFSQIPEGRNIYKMPNQSQAYPKLPLISKTRNPKTVSRVVRPLPRPKEIPEDNAGFRKAGELYLQEKSDEMTETVARRESVVDDNSEMEKSAKEKPIIPAKKRKLFNPECDSLL